MTYPARMRACPRGIAAVVLLSVFAVLAPATPARAHEVGLSRGTYAVDGERVTADIILSRREAASVVTKLDADEDGSLTEVEIAGARPAIQKAIVERIVVEAGGTPCRGALTEASLAEEDGFAVRATYTCAAPVSRARVDFALLAELAHGHRHIARTPRGVQVIEKVISRSQRSFELEGAPAAASPPRKDLPAVLALGADRMVRGYDHLLFLIALVLVSRRRRALVEVVGAFTLAHSLTLILAALGVWVPRPSIVGPAIALSLTYVGVEGLFTQDAEKRWRIAFPFGLVHGFGFAAALNALALPPPDRHAAMLVFNAGVEMGQLGVLALLLPALALLRKQPWFERYGMRLALAAIAVTGLAWFFTRVLGGAG
jgi:hypothetical protein